MADEVENISSQPVVAPAGEKVLRLEREWPYRLAGGLVIFGTIALLAGIILTLKNDLVNKRIQEVKEEFYDWAGTQGLTLDDVVVTGRKRTTLNEINRLVILSGETICLKSMYTTLNGSWKPCLGSRRPMSAAAFSKRNQY